MKKRTPHDVDRVSRDKRRVLNNEQSNTLDTSHSKTCRDILRKTCTSSSPLNSSSHSDTTTDEDDSNNDLVSCSNNEEHHLLSRKSSATSEESGTSKKMCSNELHLTHQPSMCVDNNVSKKQSFEQETAAQPTVPDVVKSFSELGVCTELCETLTALGWAVPTSIQALTLPYALNGRDIIGLAETGSGKTGAFAIPVIQKILESPRHRGIAALILAPTRELTVQIAEQFQALGVSIGLKVCTIVGGLDMVSQALELTKRIHVLVGTPGRVVDHLENTKGFSLGSVMSFVMDEADRLLSMDFEESLNKIIQVLPHKRTTYLFSATMTSRVSKLQRVSLANPVKITVSSKYDTSKNLVQNIKIISYKDKWTYFIALLTHLKAYSTIVFTNTCLDAKKLAICLRHLGFSSVCLHGKMTQPQRLGALNAFKAGRKKILVATEVGSRGLDIPHVDVVVNFDVPLTSKDYIHRVGRTARAGKSGHAITLVTQYDAEAYLKVEQALGTKFDVYQAVTDDMWESLTAKVEEAKRETEREIKESENEKNKGKDHKKKRRR